MRYWLVAVAIIAIAVTGLVFASITSLISSGGWVERSYQVLDTLDVTAAMFSDSQSNERAFVATCDASLLKPYRTDLPRIYSDLARLRTLTADNPVQQSLVQRLHSQLDAEVGRMGMEITETLKGDQKDALAALAMPQEENSSREILGIISQIKGKEKEILDGRLGRTQFFGKLTLAMCVLGVLASGTILGFIFWLMWRETTRRQRSEASLHSANAQLETSLIELRQYNDLAWSLRQMGELLQSCHDTGEALVIVSRHLKLLLPESSGAIALLHGGRADVEAKLTFGKPAPFAERFAPDQCWALRRGRAHVSRHEGYEPACTHLGHDIGIAECIPLIAQGETLGVLSVTAPGTDGFSKIEQQSIQAVTEQLSLSLANLLLQETLRERSLRDSLTGLFNRRYLGEVLPREIARMRREGQMLAVTMIDIDHFKRFNDSHGHDGGDALLAAFGELLAGHSRAEDIVCRLGGDEFAWILPGVGRQVACERAAGLRAATARMAVLLRDEPLHPPTISIGIAIFPDQGTDGPTLLRMADAALYAAKSRGRDRVVVAGEAHLVPGTDRASQAR